MEKKIVKAGLYGLIVGILFSIVYYPDVVTVQQSIGYTSYQVPLREYVFKVLRNGINICFSAIIVMGLFQVYKRLPKSEYSNKQFLWGVIKSFLIGIVIFYVIYSLITMMT
ncbi:hypothetical protein [Paenibacillus arenosi]|uniref:DUF4149 domain-containing protein n=1 Tax=Paenibacillus arenosi TaxID=2774142 RepID=A0ABR9AS61_9BACL|nr:hypothetical protein [Paenibacillus arenosi]MBD8496945.1 hypothetical protein [Paenibacillus arenosi]